MKKLLPIVFAMSLGLPVVAQDETKNTSLYDIPVTRITGEDTSLREYAGKVMLIVNTASQCGFTPQYAGLQALYERYNAEGLVVLGFPSNDFGGQEPGSEADILAFCYANYGITFPLFAKCAVKPGNAQHPLYRFLTDPATNPDHAHPVAWNFNKFLVGRDGRVLGHFGSRVAPESEELRKAIETALQAE